MKYFTYNKTFDVINPNSAKWYNIPADELNQFNSDGTNRWFSHLSAKIWFHESMFWELLEYAKNRFPDFNSDKAIFQAGKEFGSKEVSSYFEKLYPSLNNNSI